MRFSAECDGRQPRAWASRLRMVGSLRCECTSVRPDGSATVYIAHRAGEPGIMNATLQLVGDLILDQSEADSLFDLARAQLSRCDLLIGHVEIPHTLRGQDMHFAV